MATDLLQEERGTNDYSPKPQAAAQQPGDPKTGAGGHRAHNTTTPPPSPAKPLPLPHLPILSPSISPPPILSTLGPLGVAPREFQLLRFHWSLGYRTGSRADGRCPAYLEEQMEIVAPVENTQKAGYRASVKSSLNLYNKWTLSVATAKKMTKP